MVFVLQWISFIRVARFASWNKNDSTIVIKSELWKQLDGTRRIPKRKIERENRKCLTNLTKWSFRFASYNRWGCIIHYHTRERVISVIFACFFIWYAATLYSWLCVWGANKWLWQRIFFSYREHAPNAKPMENSLIRLCIFFPFVSVSKTQKICQHW